MDLTDYILQNFWTEYYGNGDGQITFQEDGSLYILGSNSSGYSDWGTSGDWNIDFPNTNTQDSPTELTMIMPENGEVSFDWDFDNDDSAYYDVAYYINSEAVMLSDPSLGNQPQSGSVTFEASEGDIIGLL